MGGLGQEGRKHMYHYLEEREFESRMRRFGGEVMQAFCHNLKEDYDISTRFTLVGSGGRNLITQNADRSVDLDYNLEIVKCEDWNDCRYLKECARKAFNKALRQFRQYDCRDSTSVLTSNRISFFTMYDSSFTIDVCIIRRAPGGRYLRLIHEKTGWMAEDKYYWNLAPSAKNLHTKAKYIKKRGKWAQVRVEYLRIKNLYLTRNETDDHPSFVCYAEAVSNVYNSRMHWK